MRLFEQRCLTYERHPNALSEGKGAPLFVFPDRAIIVL